MPIKWLMDYWTGIADKALPYLQGRKVAVEQVFDGKRLYRRHQLKSKRWIYIKTKADIAEWAHLHTYSFHTHLEGDKNTLFAMDLDKRSKKMDFYCMKIAASEMCKILEEKKIKYICKFSGGNGFHFIWAHKNSGIKGLRIFEEEQKIINRLTALLEDRIQRSKQKQKFYKYLKEGDPIFVVSSQDKDHPNSILIDEYILKRRGVIRSLYSVHPKTSWTSCPVECKNLLKFNPKTQATTKTTLKIGKIYPMPYNKLGYIKKMLEINN